MAISKTAGSKFYVSSTPVDSDDFNVSDAAALDLYEAISNWVEVGEVEDLGSHGDTSEEITFTSIGDGRTRKQKGARNAGSKTVVVGRDPLDDGQQVLIEAQESTLNYAFKVEHNDARSQSHSNSVEYFIGLVLGEEVTQGQQNNVVRQTFPISINSKPIKVQSELISS